jgi:hypothetical protein
MPNFGDQKVLASGICTEPPSASAANRRSASASLAASSDSEKPLNTGLPSQRPSLSIRLLVPTRSVACITLSSEPGGNIPGGGFSGASMLRISISTSAPSARL